ncbi:hypothetical protein CFP56_039143 [Quercus suber]|uniref:Uncharacterized protein n=1 Tax=Quercus suber TaxID=58331 RepID=A0AAW0LMZ1_QUESU
MKEVTRELHLIKSAFVDSAMCRREFRRIQVSTDAIVVLVSTLMARNMKEPLKSETSFMFR